MHNKERGLFVLLAAVSPPPSPHRNPLFKNANAMNSSANSNLFGDDPGNAGSRTSDGEYDLTFIYAGNVNAQRVTVAFLTLVVWDFLITTNDMVELFWRARWSNAKAMYLINRLTVPFTMVVILLLLAMPSPSDRACKVVSWIGVAGTTIILTPIDFTMIIRVYALWNRDKWVLTGVLILCFLHVVCYAAISCYTFATSVVIPASPPFTGCMVTFGFDKIWISFVAALLFETVVISLIVYKTWFFATQGDIRTPLFTMLFTDGVVYYLVMIASQILGLMCFLVPSALVIPVLRSYSQFSIAGVICNRLLARLQRLLLNRSKGQTGFSGADGWSSAAPEFTYGGGRAGNKTNTGLPQKSEENPGRSEMMREGEPNHHHYDQDFDDAIRMEPMTR